MHLKLDFYDLNKDKNLVSNQYTLFDSSRVSHSDCGSPNLNSYANKQNVLGRNSGVHRARTNDL